MLVSILPVPFADAACQRQYDAVLAALQAEAARDAPATVLLGNLGAFAPIEADMLVVRPGALALVVLTPCAGQLTIPALPHGPWQLDGQPVPSRAGHNNPFAQYQQQAPLALAWLSEQLGLAADELPPCTGLALFEAPLTFGPAVEAQLHRHAATADFQLVGGAAQVPVRLRYSPDFEAAVLTDDELLEWGEFLAHPYSAPKAGPSHVLATFLVPKLWQLWRWLGAEDIPADPPYGGGPPDQHLRDQQEQARLQQLRRELQAELHQQRQEAATREAARTQELALLRQQLAQAGPSATERQAEQQAKKALEESLRTTRAELATRNEELDTRIQQLGQLIAQLQAAPGTAPPTAPALSEKPATTRPAGPVAAPLAAPTPPPKPRPAAAPAWPLRRKQAERWSLVLLAVASAGVGTWGVVRWAHHPAPRPATTALRGAAPEADVFAKDQPTSPTDPADSMATAQAAAVDTAGAQSPPPEPAATATEPIVPPTQLHTDSAAAVIQPTPLVEKPDSAAGGASPAP